MMVVKTFFIVNDYQQTRHNGLHNQDQVSNNVQTRHATLLQKTNGSNRRIIINVTQMMTQKHQLFDFVLMVMGIVVALLGTLAGTVSE
jgi:hypothetical protein